MYDAVHVLAKSLDDLSRMSGFNPMPINCMQGGGQWRDGQRGVYNMRNMRNSPAHGLTGEITFDEDGFRDSIQYTLKYYLSHKSHISIRDMCKLMISLLMFCLFLKEFSKLVMFKCL